jgi:ABC-type transport system substrate-binding protein
MSRPVSRRAFIAGGAAAGATIAAGGAFALSQRGGSKPSASPAVGETETPATQASSATPSPTPRRGGKQVLAATSELSFDTFDAQLTGKSATVEILGRTHSRLLQWGDTPDGKLYPDLAASWETPDEQTLILHLDPAACWQPKAPLNGRAVTAQDIVANVNRALQLAAESKAPLAQRYKDYAKVTSVDSPSAGVVRIRTSAPDQFLLETLAGEFAFVQAPEAVEAFAAQWSKLDSDHVVGSGPWLFDWADDGLKFSAWQGGHRKPLLDEIRVVEAAGSAQRFIGGELDEVTAFDRRDTAAVRSGTTSLPNRPTRPDDPQKRPAGVVADSSELLARQILLTTFRVDTTPWNNPQLVTALSGALNRYELADRLLGGRAWAAGPVPESQDALVTSATRLKFEAGYATTGTEVGTSAYKEMWEAAGGPGLGTVTIDFPSVFDPLYSASSVVIGMLNEALGPQFRPAIETYTTISKRVSDGYYGGGRAALWFGWGPPLSGPSGSRYFEETYATGSAGQRVSRGPGATDADPIAIARQGFLGIVPWVQQRFEVFRRVEASGPQPSPFWTQHLDYLRSSA